MKGGTKVYRMWKCDKCNNSAQLPVGYDRKLTIDDTYEDIVCRCSGKNKNDFTSDYYSYYGVVFIKFKEGKYI